MSTSGDWEADPLGHIGHLVHKATLPTQGSSEMRRQGNRSQTKEMEDKKRLDKEFKTMLIRLFKNLQEKADKINETYEDMKRDQLEIIKDQQEIIKDQLEIKNIFSEIKNIMQSPKNRMEIARSKSKIWNTKSQRTLLRRSKKTRESRKLKIM